MAVVSSTFDRSFITLRARPSIHILLSWQRNKIDILRTIRIFFFQIILVMRTHDIIKHYTDIERFEFIFEHRGEHSNITLRNTHKNITVEQFVTGLRGGF